MESGILCVRHNLRARVYASCVCVRSCACVCMYVCVCVCLACLLSKLWNFLASCVLFFCLTKLLFHADLELS